MSIVIPSSVPVTPVQQLVRPPMGLVPLQNALQLGNYLWRYYAPPLVDDWTSGSDADGPSTTGRWVTPIRPSVDGLTYRLVVTLTTSLVATASIEVFYCTAWSGFAGTTWTSLGTASPTTSATLATVATIDAVIPANAVALRWTVTISSGTFTVHHVLAYPRQTTLASGVKASGAVPYDDGLFTAAGQPPVNTELLNRGWITARALAADRLQAALTYLQPETTANSGRLRSVSSASWHRLCLQRVWFGAQRPLLHARVLATVSAGSTADLIRIRQVLNSGDSVDGPGLPWDSGLLAADETIVSGPTPSAPILQGSSPRRYADFAIEVRSNGTGSTRLHSARLMAALCEVT